jgi:adenylyltransferase/sulfurtransferase
MVLSQMGEAAQRRVMASHAVIIGVGALGSVAADLLVRAGVGRVTLVDRDLVDTTNLQRQTLFTEQDAREGRAKADAAAARLSTINSDVELLATVIDVKRDNIERVVQQPPREQGGVVVILDGTDNFETRYLINDACVEHRVALAYAGAVGTRFMQMTFVPGRGCLRCVFEDAPSAGHGQTCDVVGVLGPAVAIAAAAQVSDALRVMASPGQFAPGTLLEGTLWPTRVRTLDLSTALGRPDCPCCGLGRRDFLHGIAVQDSVVLCGQDAVQVSPQRATTLDLSEVASRLSPMGGVRAGRFFVRVELGRSERSPGGTPLDVTIFADGRAIVRGTSDLDVARAAYARVVGS